MPSLPTAKDDQAPVGHQIRDLRKAKRMTLARLAEHIGRSVGYVSQVERGLSEVSIPTLTRIAEALEVQIAWFFQQGEPAAAAEREFIVRAANRRRLRYTGTGVTEELLSPALSGESLMVLTRTEPGADSGEPIRREVEESGFVKSGVLALSIDGRWHRLNEGDSFCLPRGTHHQFRNPGDAPCEVVWILTPANY